MHFVMIHSDSQIQDLYFNLNSEGQGTQNTHLPDAEESPGIWIMENKYYFPNSDTPSVFSIRGGVGRGWNPPHVPSSLKFTVIGALM